MLADLRAERGEARPERVARTARSAQPGGADGDGTAAAPRAGSPMSPELSGWLRAAKIRVQQAWVLGPAMRGQKLETRIEVELDAQGKVLSEPRIVRRSGDPWYDESVVRAIQKASPLPPPPSAGKWPFVFRPEDFG